MRPEFHVSNLYADLQGPAATSHYTTPHARSFRAIKYNTHNNNKKIGCVYAYRQQLTIADPSYGRLKISCSNNRKSSKKEPALETLVTNQNIQTLR